MYTQSHTQSIFNEEKIPICVVLNISDQVRDNCFKDKILQLLWDFMLFLNNFLWENCLAKKVFDLKIMSKIC